MLKEFITDLLETEDVLDFLNESNKQWGSWVSKCLEDPRNAELLKGNSELLEPLMEAFQEVLAEYDIEDISLDLVVAGKVPNDGSWSEWSESLIWGFSDAKTKDCILVYPQRANNEEYTWKSHTGVHSKDLWGLDARVIYRPSEASPETAWYYEVGDTLK